MAAPSIELGIYPWHVSKIETLGNLRPLLVRWSTPLYWLSLLLSPLMPILFRLRPRFAALGRLLIDAAHQWSEHRAASKGAALALYMVFSLTPMLILVIAVAGVFFGDQAVQSQLVGQLHGLLGERGAEVIQIVLASARQSKTGIVATLISICMLLFSATTAFAELKDSLDELWEVRRKDKGVKRMLRRRLRAFSLVLVLAFFLLFSLTVDAALAMVQRYYGPLWHYAIVIILVKAFTTLFSFALLTALFAAIYKLLPQVVIPWRYVIPGAIVTAGLFLLGKWGIGLYLSRGAVASAYGAAGSVVAFLLWIYYSAQVFFFGAVLTRQYARHLERARRAHSH